MLVEMIIAQFESYLFQMNNNKELFDGMVLFCTIVEQQSLSAGAKILGHTPSHVSKELARLEDRLGTRLLNRTTRTISLTETGRIYYENSRRLVNDANVVERQIHSLGDRPFGELKISVPEVFARGCFNSWMPEFLERYPDISLNAHISDRRVDLVAEGFDLVVRIGELPSSDLISRELFKTGMPTIAAPNYLKQHGTPSHPSELAKHTLITFANTGAGQTWSYTGMDGIVVGVKVTPSVICNDAELEKTLAVQGHGITRLPELVCSTELENRHLVRILKEYEKPAAGVHLIYAAREHLPPKSRAMADFLVEKTKGRKANNFR